MDGLDEFEKSLAEEKEARESSRKESGRDKERKHKHHHRSKHHKSKDDGDSDRDNRRSKHHLHRSHDDAERDDHSHKRSRHSREGDEDHHRRPRRNKTSDPHEDLPLPDDEEPSRSPKPVRDSWMTTPSAMDFDYTQKGVKKAETAPPPKPDYDLKIHKNELNVHLQDLADGKKLDDIDPEENEVDYTFGDSGAQWRMTKLKAVETQAEQTGKTIDEIAAERFGSLKEFDDAREEQIELDRRQLYGPGYVGKERPSGELFQARKLELGMRGHHGDPSDNQEAELPQGKILEAKAAHTTTVTLDHTALNRLKAQLMKAKIKKSPDVGKLEAEYITAMANYSNNPGDSVVVLGTMDNRLLAGTRGEVKSIDNKRGRERGLVEDNEDMSIEDMVREERRTKHQAGGESMRAAERIAKDGKFDDNLDYMDDNANKLAKRVQKSEVNLKNAAVGEFQKMNRILDSCQLCHHEETNQAPVAPLLSLATRVYLTLPTEPELSEGGAVIVPIQHRTNLLECDDDEWEEIRNFMKCLTRMYHDQGRDVVFYENAAAPQRKMHAAMQAVPLPYSLGETAPAFFKEAILSADEEWTQHKKLIDTAARARDGMGKQAFRRSIAKEMPYFHAWFQIDGGLGHIVEDLHRWPRGDLFAREVIGGMLDIEPDVIKRQGRWIRGDKRAEGFKKRFRKFDWTRVLTDGQVL
ncbi:CwfJ C-terminus 1-domain-containing protein-like protein [Amylocarpus encephaloides]|uniref:CwfJ C-terminus 1-domain-containing protein-like protein n=1 Tax=Amylocarpus encephaloides TaxID=45428 RepID=A0A9P7YDV9_9HELO|nr:CwfJ C-terminus 1-domain-containing protein-like protein [Amylocarpus encephaloides]